MNTKHKGDISQTETIVALLKLGMPVMTPVGDNQRYDLVVEHPSGKLLKVQCKTATSIYGGSVLRFDTASSHYSRGGKKRNYRGQIDVFAAYSPDTDRVYFVGVDEAGDTNCTLRLNPPKNGQAKNVRYAADYELFPCIGD